MTRSEKIKALADDATKDLAERYDGRYHPKLMASEWFKAGILAGIALRDAELLASVGEWSLAKFKENFSVDGERYALGQRFTYTDAQLELIYKGSQAQHEQVIKAIKGDGDDSNAP